MNCRAVDAARLRDLVDRYTDAKQYGEFPGRAVELARQILALCRE